LRLATLLCIALSLAGAAGAVRAAGPPQPGLIAFVRENPTRADINAAVDLWVVRTDGRGARKVVGSSGWDENPAWSPDGRRIAFDKGLYEAGEREDVLKTIDVWVVDVSGRGRKNVTHDGSASLAAWSPKRKALAFARGDGIFVIEPNGSGRRHVGRRADPTQPAWSPDGTRVAFTTPGELWIAGARGTGQRRVALGASSDTRAAWSPDGRSLSYAGSSGKRFGVFAVKVTGGRPRLLSRLDEQAIWSPDGRRIALVRSGTARQAGIFLAATDGRARRRLTRGLDTEPVWSPDGRTIAFRRGLLVGDIYLVDADGSNLRNLTRTPKLDERHLAWQPR
jgi:Tol biopolymer transport system component